MIYRSGLKVLDDDNFVIATLTRADAFVDMSKIYHASVDEDGEWDVAQAVLEGLIVDPLAEPPAAKWLAEQIAKRFPGDIEVEVIQDAVARAALRREAQMAEFTRFAPSEMASMQETADFLRNERFEESRSSNNDRK